jgi:hypothetical protein
MTIKILCVEQKVFGRETEQSKQPWDRPGLSMRAEHILSNPMLNKWIIHQIELENWLTIGGIYILILNHTPGYYAKEERQKE